MTLLHPVIVNGVEFLGGLFIAFVWPRVVKLLEAHIGTKRFDHLQALAAEYAPVVLNELKTVDNGALVSDLASRLDTTLKHYGFSEATLKSVATNAITWAKRDAAIGHAASDAPAAPVAAPAPAAAPAAKA